MITVKHFRIGPSPSTEGPTWVWPKGFTSTEQEISKALNEYAGRYGELISFDAKQEGQDYPRSSVYLCMAVFKK